MLLGRLITVILLAYSSVASAGSVDVNMSNHAAEFQLGISTGGNGEIQTGFLYNDQGGGLVDAGLVVNGGGDSDAASGVTGGGGVKVIAGRLQQTGTNYYVSAIAIGGQVGYTFPAAPSVSLAGEYFVAMKITSFGDTDRYNQFSFRLEFGPPHAKVFVGYREITFDIIGVGNVYPDKSGYTGVMFTF